MPDAPPEPATAADPRADAWLAVMREMHARRELGLERYGRPVAAGDGEDYLRHLMDEVLDALPYLVAFRAERDTLLAERDRLARRVAELEAALDEKTRLAAHLARERNRLEMRTNP